MNITDETEYPALAWYRATIEAVHADVVAALRKHWPHVGSQLIAHALIETTGTVLGAIVTTDPASAQDIDTKICEMRLFVTPAHATDQKPGKC